MELRTESYRADWNDATDTIRWLEREIFIGEVLNFPCGKSPVGDVKADIDSDLNPDVVASLDEWPFQPNSFDTVYLDPPFSLWSQSRGGFIMDAWRTARERLVCQTGLEKVTIPNVEPEFYVNRPRGPGFSLKVFQVFDDLDTRIDDLC